MTRSGHGDALLMGIGIVCAVILLTVLWYVMGYRDCRSNMRKEAVEHGAAEYVLDQKTGQSTWRWKVTP